MNFTCPHCGTTFYAPTRRGSTSEKAKQAARRNGALGGRTPKVSDVDAVLVFKKKATWVWQDFVIALKKATGVELSRARAFALLKRLKAQRANKVVFNDGGLDEAVKQDDHSPVRARVKKAPK